MSDNTGRYMFAGHALGVAARFHRLDELENLNHVIPTLGACVLAATGGRSHSHRDGPYRYEVDQPRKQCLLAVDRIDAWVEGRQPDGRLETEVNVEVDGLGVVEKLRVESIRLHILAVRKGMDGEAEVTTRGNRIDGMRMGHVEARIVLDDEPLSWTGSQGQLAGFYRSRDTRYRERNRERFYTTADGTALADDHGCHRFSLVREIHLSGPESERQAISVEGNTIHWKGFGRIILGEVHVKGDDRRVSLVRLAMGSDAAGDGTAGGGQSNGSATGG
jgi:hypothetical protein